MYDNFIFIHKRRKSSNVIVYVYMGKCLCEFVHMAKQYCCVIVSTWEMLQKFSIPNDKL